jgi:hypothetical protein
MAGITNRYPRSSVRLTVALFLEEECTYDSKQGSTLYKGSSDNHVGTDVTYSFWLTSDRFHSFTTDLSDTDTGTEYRQSCTYSS